MDPRVTSLEIADGDSNELAIVDPHLGGKIRLLTTDEIAATVYVHSLPDGSMVVTVYRDLDVPVIVRTVDYFDGSRNGLSGSDPGYYTVLRDG